MTQPRLILAVESSCDETGVALMRVPSLTAANSRPVLLGHALHTQIALHAQYGGVVPELASRDHIRHVLPLVQTVLQQTGATLAEIDILACTQGPGLSGALLVGMGCTAALAMALGKPFLGVHHLEGHLLSPFLSAAAPNFPFLALLVSGGHTQLVRVAAVGQYTLLGESIDDAAGEAFDKCAKLLGLPYPGGAALAQLALSGQADAYAFPRPLWHSGDCDFSFAGLKTAVLVQVQKLQRGHGALDDPAQSALRADVAASVQAAIVDVLVHKTVQALRNTGLPAVVVAGGVGANMRLRECLRQSCQQMGVQVFYPALEWCSDNGAMIAVAAALRVQAGVAEFSDGYQFTVRPRWPLTQA